MPNYYGPKIATDGLQLYLDATNTKSYPGSGTNWTDLTGNNYNGTLSGPTFGGDGGGSLVFDGADDLVQVPYYVPTDISFTVSIWLKNSANNQGHYVSQLNDSATWDGFCVMNGGTGGNRIQFILLKTYNTSVQLFLESASVINLNTWYNVTCLYNQTQGQIYLNGALDVSANYNGGFDGTSYWNLGIGSRTTTGSPLNGKIGNVSIYNRALSSNEILQNYNVNKTRYGL